jgi:hypothetical protein
LDIVSTTDGVEELSRSEQRRALREHWLGAAHRALEQSFLRPTGLIIGLPVLLAFIVSLMTLHRAAGLRWLNRALAVLSVAVFKLWIVKIFATG